MSFTQQLALVTGAGSGIGRATALLLAQLGARVIITDRNPQSLQETQQQIQAQGGQAFCETVDVAFPTINVVAPIVRQLVALVVAKD